MSYATFADVDERLPESVKAQMSVVSELITTERTALYQRINARLTQRYTMPAVQATSPGFYALLMSIEADLAAAAAIEFARELADENSDQLWYPTRLRARAELLLDQLADGTLSPEDAVASDTHAAQVPYDGLTDDDVSPTFATDDVW